MRLRKYLAEHKRVLYFAGVVALLTSVPYLLGYTTQNDSWIFTGFVVGVEDGNSYLAKMLSGAAGSWLFRSPHSAEAQRGVIAYMPYLLLGKLSSPPAQHDQLVALYQLFRVSGILLAVLASYDFISLFVANTKLRWWALIMVTLGGGSGWVLALLQQKHFLGSLPLEFLSPESFGFLGFLGFPHLAAARALFLWGFVLYMKSDRGWAAGMLWLTLGFFQPMVVVIGWAVIGAQYLLSALRSISISSTRLPDHGAAAIGWKQVLKIAQAVAVSSPIVIYTVVSFLTDPYLVGLAAQLVMPSPAVGHYLVAYGLYLPLAVLGIKKIWAEKGDRASLLAGWMLILPFLIYAPVAPQRRLAEGIWAVIITGMMLYFDRPGEIRWPTKLYFLLALPSTLLLLAGATQAAMLPGRPQFRPAAEVAAYQYLAGDISAGAVVLTAFETGNNLPAWAPVRVVQGHGPETIHRDQVERDLDLFFSEDSSTADQKAFLSTWNVTYLVWGPLERGQWFWDPEQADFLSRIYNRDGYAIYEVSQNR